jgi:anti-sigma28 factor (negative regulator of flagellin synthesis)
MMRQGFPDTHVFNRQLRHRRRAELQRLVTGSHSEAGVRSARTGRGCRCNNRLLTPGQETRADKIAQLRHAVESGDYRVSAEQIAEKMVREALVAMLT